MKYKIFIDKSTERVISYLLVTESNSKDDAEGFFSDYQEVNRYLELMKPYKGQIFPLVLVEMEGDYGNKDDEGDPDPRIYGSELDRFEPALIFDDEIFTADQLHTNKYGSEVWCGNREWVLFEDHETAGEAAAQRWRDMANNDREEFACIIGTERLVQWALGESDSFGISSLEDFLEVTATVPEEEFASYDGVEIEIQGWSAEAESELGVIPGVAYRRN